ncbi:hypothetical protein V1478_004689 [Vespula squamosa]|uniref:Uncharacterized protein n=1 Tax=Vespula squamosa TaxID=30214 RepID=A0ABD2BGX7_VESSQ
MIKGNAKERKRKKEKSLVLDQKHTFRPLLEDQTFHDTGYKDGENEYERNKEETKEINETKICLFRTWKNYVDDSASTLVGSETQTDPAKARAQLTPDIVVPSPSIIATGGKIRQPTTSFIAEEEKRQRRRESSYFSLTSKLSASSQAGCPNKTEISSAPIEGSSISQTPFLENDATFFAPHFSSSFDITTISKQARSKILPAFLNR